MNKLIFEKVTELIELAKQENELSAASILLTLAGAMTAGQERELAFYVGEVTEKLSQELTKEELKPGWVKGFGYFGN